MRYLTMLLQIQALLLVNGSSTRADYMTADLADIIDWHPSRILTGNLRGAVGARDVQFDFVLPAGAGRVSAAEAVAAGWVESRTPAGSVDGTITHVTAHGPHTHDYGVDGVYIVAVIGSVTAYNSDTHGGPQQERWKLVSVDSWGQVGFTSLAAAFRDAANLISVPADSDGIEAVINMSSMFRGASSFNQDLSGWCVELITSQPTGFDLYATSWVLPRPEWGTCPD